MDDRTSAVATGPIETDYPDPLWIQVLRLIDDQVGHGKLKPGNRLPPERQLAQDLGVSRVTLRKALTHLVDEGKIRPAQGRGWYVEGEASEPTTTEEWPNRLESFSETAKRMGLEGSSRVLRADTEPASIDLAETLGIPPGVPIFHLERVRLLGGVPVAVDASQIPVSLAPDLMAHDFSSQSLFQVLLAAGVEPVRTESVIEALAADDHIADMLGIGVGQPLLVMRQLALDSTDHKLFTSTIKYAGQRYRLRTSFVR